MTLLLADGSMKTHNTEKRDICKMIRKIEALQPFYSFVIKEMIYQSDPTTSETLNKLNIIVREEKKKIGYCDVIPSLFLIQELPNRFKTQSPMT
jgi:hypothetical protein